MKAQIVFVTMKEIVLSYNHGHKKIAEEKT